MSNDALGNKIRYKQNLSLNGKYGWRTIFARCRYQPYRIIFLPVLLLISVLVRCFYKISSFSRRNTNHKGQIKPIALYLPQYHTIPENDDWWGKGFTEWTNVRKAKPLFPGHYQPHVPHPDIGYYDLSDVSVMKKQADMAKRYGIYGFCFYYYHFKDGKRLLEKPLNNWLSHPEIDFPFCFSWANENWTRSWDGGDKKVIMPQDYDKSNMNLMIREMISAFKDKRYIKVDGKPVLLVYRPEIIPNCLDVVARWREIAVENGFPGLYLVMMQNFSFNNPTMFGMDAASEFAAIKRHGSLFEENEVDVMPLVGLNAVRYDAVRRFHREQNAKSFIRYKCVCPGWDNTPRRGYESHFILDAAPCKFEKMLEDACRATLEDAELKKNGYVFINAWNEWGEGAHLEPDEKYGYANLEAVKRCVSRFA